MFQLETNLDIACFLTQVTLTLTTLRELSVWCPERTCQVTLVSGYCAIRLRVGQVRSSKLLQTRPNVSCTFICSVIFPSFVELWVNLCMYIALSYVACLTPLTLVMALFRSFAWLFPFAWLFWHNYFSIQISIRMFGQLLSLNCVVIRKDKLTQNLRVMGSV